MGWAWVLACAAGCYTGVEPSAPAQPRSLQDVDVDGGLSTDTAGRFVFDAQARALFDHFLVATGEVDDDALRLRVVREIEQRLPGQAASQAIEAFDAYVDYRAEATELVQPAGPGPHPRVGLEAQLADIRARTVGDVAGVPDEGPRLAAAVRWSAVADDPNLAVSDRREQLRKLRSQLGDATPDDDPSRLLLRVRAALADIPAEDLDARRAVVTGLAGAEAAHRWIALEQRRAAALVSPG
ncbi:MAG: hypothetical protein K0V04_23360 [Deltaproteobacteria bacterium]|nr:hypothetical protein [Deltaproteobacteria bacterium]